MYCISLTPDPFLPDQIFQQVLYYVPVLKRKRISAQALVKSRLVIRIHIASVRLKSYKDLIVKTEPYKTTSPQVFKKKTAPN